LYIPCGSSLRRSLKKACERRGIHVTFRDLNPVGVITTLLNWRPKEERFFLVMDDPERVRDTHAVDDFVRDAYDTFLDSGKYYAIIMVTRLSLKKAYETYECLKDSRFRPIPMVFRPYTVTEITEILRQRLHYAFERDDVYDLDALKTIAKHVYRIGSDIREAIEILRYAVLNVAKKRLTVYDAEEAVEWAKKNWWIERLMSLPPHWRLLLYTAAKMARKEKGEGLKAKAYEVIDEYKSALKKQTGVKPLGKTSIYHALKKMGDVYDFFMIEKVMNGGRRILELQFDEEEARHIVQAGDEMDLLATTFSTLRNCPF